MNAASFDCSKATKAIEKEICSTEELNYLDSLLGKNYIFILKSLDNFDKSKFILEQRKWISKRNTCTNLECIKQSYLSKLDVYTKFISDKKLVYTENYNDKKIFYKEDNQCKEIPYKKSILEFPTSNAELIYPEISYLSKLIKNKENWTEKFDAYYLMLNSMPTRDNLLDYGNSYDGRQVKSWVDIEIKQITEEKVYFTINYSSISGARPIDNSVYFYIDRTKGTIHDIENHKLCQKLLHSKKFKEMLIGKSFIEDAYGVFFDDCTDIIVHDAEHVSFFYERGALVPNSDVTINFNVHELHQALPKNLVNEIFKSYLEGNYIVESCGKSISNKEAQIEEFFEVINPMIYKLAEKENRVYLYYLNNLLEEQLEEKYKNDKTKYWSSYSFINKMLAKMSNNNRDKEIYENLGTLYKEYKYSSNGKKRQEVMNEILHIRQELSSSIDSPTAEYILKTHKILIDDIAKTLLLILEDANKYAKKVTEEKLTLDKDKLHGMTIEEILIKKSSAISSEAPIQINKHTQILSSYVSGKTMFVAYSLDDLAADRLAQKSIQKKQEQININTHCSDIQQKKLLQMGANYIFNYYKDNGTFIFRQTISLSHCLN